jgi:stearoyl-CoA desaturase (delta-9 desaturase)
MSRNNAVVWLLALGEGWHNNHHAFPSARHGLRWWQIDLSYYIIRVLVLFCMAWKVRFPAAEELRSRRRRKTAAPATTADAQHVG